MKKVYCKADEIFDISFELDIPCAFEYQTGLAEIHPQRFGGG
jgi:hypothetical protein